MSGMAAIRGPASPSSCECNRLSPARGSANRLSVGASAPGQALYQVRGESEVRFEGHMMIRSEKEVQPLSLAVVEIDV